MTASEQCSNPVDVSTMDQLPGSGTVCGCGQCPEPDPTPAELQRRVDQAAWQRAASMEETS